MTSAESELHSQSNLAQNAQPGAESANQALELLRHEARLHQDQTAQTSWLGQAVVGVSEFWHESDKTGKNVSDLASQIQADLKGGTAKSDDAAKLASQAQAAITADRAALTTRAEISSFGTGVVQAAGLFMGGRKGFALAAGAAALDAVKPASHETIGTQAVDVGLGISRALVLKSGYIAAGHLNLGIATTAVGLGVGSRVTDLALNRNTYLDARTGQYDAHLGGARIWAGSTDKTALASDVVTMVLAKGVLGKLDKVSEGSLTSSKFISTVATGGVFGLAKGSVDEVIRQRQTGNFDPEQFALRTALSGASSIAGAALGGLPALREARPNFAGSTAREYQLSLDNINLPVAKILAGSAHASVMTRVREVTPGGKLGPEQNLLVQHAGSGIVFSEGLAAKADIIATCNPATLPSGARDRHIMPTATGDLFLTQSAGGRLSFSERLAQSLRPALSSSLSTTVALGPQSVSSLLRAPESRGLLRFKDTHDLGLYSDVLKGFKTPALKIIDGGADSVVVQLADQNILKITHLDWDPTWGHRTYEDARGNRFRFDARIIGEPVSVKRPDGQATYYVQERAQTPVSATDLQHFQDLIHRNSKYLFTDPDTSQLGYVNLPNNRRGLALLDYDSVQTPRAVQDELRRLRDERNENY